ncbi:MAG: YggS family pyridoxal phosphate-dependent enzyme [Bacteroidota bacterium]|nr:YggS family pyridoxal phosphate-dependent enzyme [Bacteroidota bacterium]
MVAENIQNIRENIAKTCFRLGRDPQSVELIAVSKTFGSHHINEALASGIHDFGENYVQELLEKKAGLEGKNVRWHFIGHLQSNKIKYLIDWIYLIQSVDSESVAAEIQKRAQSADKTMNVLVEVNTSEEATKFGVKPNAALGLIKKIALYPNINLKGLMTIGPFTDTKDESRDAFKLLRTIFEEANRSGFLKGPMTILSMGMTHDYEIAIEEGSTMIRIGTAIFGSRTQQ